MSVELRRQIVKADRASEDEDSALDVIAYLAIVECGLFGQSVYS